MTKTRLPKKECCLDRPRCKRCPIRALAEGTLPPGYTVKRRHLVRLDADSGGQSLVGEAAAHSGKRTSAKKKNQRGTITGTAGKKSARKVDGVTAAA